MRTLARKCAHQFTPLNNEEIKICFLLRNLNSPAASETVEFDEGPSSMNSCVSLPLTDLPCLDCSPVSTAEGVSTATMSTTCTWTSYRKSHAVTARPVERRQCNGGAQHLRGCCRGQHLREQHVRLPPAASPSKPVFAKERYVGHVLLAAHAHDGTPR